MTKIFFILATLVSANCWADSSCLDKIKNMETCYDASFVFDECSKSRVPAEIIAERNAVTEICLKEREADMTNDDFMFFNYIQIKCKAKYSKESAENKALGISHCEMEGAQYLNELLEPFKEPVM